MCTQLQTPSVGALGDDLPDDLPGYHRNWGAEGVPRPCTDDGAPQVWAPGGMTSGTVAGPKHSLNRNRHY